MAEALGVLSVAGPEDFAARRPSLGDCEEYPASLSSFPLRRLDECERTLTQGSEPTRPEPS